MFKRIKAFAEVCAYLWVGYVFLVPAWRGFHGYFQEHQTLGFWFSIVVASGVILALAFQGQPDSAKRQTEDPAPDSRPLHTS